MIQLISQPGIQRDGTFYSSPNYIGGQNTRFYQGLPRKIAGCKVISTGSSIVINSLFSIAREATEEVASSVDIYCGRYNSISFLNLTQNSQLIGSEVDRTPTGFNPTNDVNYTWTIDLFPAIQAETPPTPYVIAHAAPNANDIANTTNGIVYYGAIQGPNDLLPLQPVTNTGSAGGNLSVSGGIIYINPLMLAFGNNGQIFWSRFPYTIDMDANQTTVSKTKIVAGIPYRSNTNNAQGNSVPSLLMWSLNELLRVYYTVVDDVYTFSSQTIQSGISLMSPKSIVQYNNIIYWVGENQFYYYNGVVNKLKNKMNQDWFFNNINYNYRAKTFAWVNPRFGELWIHYCRGTSTEPNAVVIYGIEDEIWYDTQLSRSSAIIPTTFEQPIMGGSELESINLPHTGIVQRYPLWQHEVGQNKVIGNIQFPIDTYIQTHFIDLFSKDPQNSNYMWTRKIAPDLVQDGNMTIQVQTLESARSPIETKGPFLFTKNDAFIDDVNTQGVLTSFIFESNTLDGYFQFGKTILYYTVGNVIK